MSNEDVTKQRVTHLFNKERHRQWPARRSGLGLHERHRAERARASRRAFEGKRRGNWTILEDDEKRAEVALRDRSPVGEIEGDSRARASHEGVVADDARSDKLEIATLPAVRQADIRAAEDTLNVVESGRRALELEGLVRE